MSNHPEALELSKQLAVLKPQPIPPKVANIAECSIATDSVVATATVRTDATMRRIVVQWGDGTVNTLRHMPGIEGVIAQHNPLPPGTYKLSHAYEEAQDRKPFEQLVLIRVEDSGGVDFCFKQITLTPRYRVTHYRTSLSLLSAGDSPFEATSEFDIRLFVDQELVKAWHWEPYQVLTPSPPVVLEGSAVSRELTAAERVQVQLLLTETDPVFDDHLSVMMDLSHLAEGDSITGITVSEDTVLGQSPCRVRYSYVQEVTLIVPLPSYGQTVVGALSTL